MFYIKQRYILKFCASSWFVTFRHLSFRLPAEAGLSEADSQLDWGNILSPFSLAATKKLFLTLGVGPKMRINIKEYQMMSFTF